MSASEPPLLEQLLVYVSPRLAGLLGLVEVHPLITAARGAVVPRAVLAQALNIGLLGDLLDRSPLGRAYVEDLRASGGRLHLDHGALRTVDAAGMGLLPRGIAAITRVLEPLGYAKAGDYPLSRLRMTGRSYAHLDLPEAIPQFFVSELHVAEFSEGFQAAAARVTASSRDPLKAEHLDLLDQLSADGSLPLAQASLLLPRLLGCFARQHDAPDQADYEALLAESAEMAWIATEGNVFNHATDRVSSLEAVAAEQRRKGRPMKEAVEISGSGRVRQTALRADMVEREFTDGNKRVRRTVPGSFFEFIERDRLPDSAKLDLSFDSGNAQGIFKMTAAG